jgi:hypothetical protein
VSDWNRGEVLRHRNVQAKEEKREEGKCAPDERVLFIDWSPEQFIAKSKRCEKITVDGLAWGSGTSRTAAG